GEVRQGRGLAGRSRNAFDIPDPSALSRKENRVVIGLPAADPTLSVFVRELRAPSAVSVDHAHVGIRAVVALICDGLPIMRPDWIAAPLFFERELSERSIGPLLLEPSDPDIEFPLLHDRHRQPGEVRAELQVRGRRGAGKLTRSGWAWEVGEPKQQPRTTVVRIDSRKSATVGQVGDVRNLALARHPLSAEMVRLVGGDLT